MNKNIKLQKGDFVTIKNKTGIEHYNIMGKSSGKTISKFEKDENCIVLNAKRTTTIYKHKEILDDKEKEYLSAVIKPFKKDIIYISKRENLHNDNEWICIAFKNTYIPFPSFKNGTMYKGMKACKEYTLEELEL